VDCILPLSVWLCLIPLLLFKDLSKIPSNTEAHLPNIIAINFQKIKKRKGREQALAKLRHPHNNNLSLT